MWRWVLVLSVVTGSAAEAGQVRSSFQVGLTITGRVNTSAAVTQKPASATSAPLPRPRPADGSTLTRSQASGPSPE